MMREEAIERLKQNKAAAEFYAGMAQNTNAIENELKDIEAIDMAIEALSAEAVQGWIPCSERLPVEFYVLCCDSRGEMIIAHPSECDDSDTGFSAESEECYMCGCIAWMPLPKPYEQKTERRG